MPYIEALKESCIFYEIKRFDIKGNAPVGQISFFDGLETRPKQMITETPARNAPCPCGSGRKYKNSCGKK